MLCIHAASDDSGSQTLYSKQHTKEWIINQSAGKLSLVLAEIKSSRQDCWVLCCLY